VPAGDLSLEASEKLSPTSVGRRGWTALGWIDGLHGTQFGWLPRLPGALQASALRMLMLNCWNSSINENARLIVGLSPWPWRAVQNYYHLRKLQNARHTPISSANSKKYILAS